MSFNYHWTAQDFVAAQFAALRKRPLRLLRALWYPLAICLIALWVLVTNPSRWPNVLGAFGAVFVMLAFAVLFATWRWKRQFRRSKSLGGLLQAVLDESGIQINSANSQVRTPWQDLRAFTESSRFIVLEDQVGEAIFIPKTSLSSVETEQLRSIIRTYFDGTSVLAVQSSS